VYNAQLARPPPARRSARRPLPTGGSLPPRFEPLDISIVRPSSSSYRSAAGPMSEHLHAPSLPPPSTLSQPTPSRSNFSIRRRGQRTKKTGAPRDAARARCCFKRRFRRTPLLPVINRIRTVPPARPSVAARTRYLSRCTRDDQRWVRRRNERFISISVSSKSLVNSCCRVNSGGARVERLVARLTRSAADLAAAE
jgi:hypothetical protein